MPDSIQGEIQKAITEFAKINVLEVDQEILAHTTLFKLSPFLDMYHRPCNMYNNF